MAAVVEAVTAAEVVAEVAIRRARSAAIVEAPCGRSVTAVVVRCARSVAETAEAVVLSVLLAAAIPEAPRVHSAAGVAVVPSRTAPVFVVTSGRRFDRRTAERLRAAILPFVRSTAAAHRYDR